VSAQLICEFNNGSKTESLNENNLREYSYGGIYKAALFADIATYPNALPGG
jgi:hypothetical protein